jgi:hypothetical protein
MLAITWDVFTNFSPVVKEIPYVPGRKAIPRLDLETLYDII